MKLYDTGRAPNPRRVRWLMAEKGIDDIEIAPLNLMSGEHKNPDFVSLAGVANVPALTLDDGETITESIAICRYLESLYPEPNLFGRDARETAIFEMWLRRAELMVGHPLMLAVRHGHPALAVLETQIAEVGDNNLQGAERSLSLFDRRLGQSEWIAGDRISMADGVMFIAIEFARMIRFKPDESLANVVRWHEAMRARPSAAAGAS